MGWKGWGSDLWERSMENMQLYFHTVKIPTGSQDTSQETSRNCMITGSMNYMITGYITPPFM